LPLLPGTGRGTMRSMVEGYAVSSAAYDLPYPSTTLRVVPLPPWGRIGNGRFRSITDNIPVHPAKTDDNPAQKLGKSPPRLPIERTIRCLSDPKTVTKC
jgi:hypothetical protein